MANVCVKLVTDRLLGAWMWNVRNNAFIVLAAWLESRRLSWESHFVTTALRYYIGFGMHIFPSQYGCLPHASSIYRLPLYVRFVFLESHMLTYQPAAVALVAHKQVSHNFGPDQFQPLPLSQKNTPQPFLLNLNVMLKNGIVHL